MSTSYAPSNKIRAADLFDGRLVSSHYTATGPVMPPIVHVKIDKSVLRGVITPKLKNRIDGWVATNGKEVRIAPYLYRDLIECARLPEA